MASGDITEEDILADYPDLEPADIRAVQAHAARMAKRKTFVPIPAA